MEHKPLSTNVSNTLRQEQTHSGGFQDSGSNASTNSQVVQIEVVDANIKELLKNPANLSSSTAQCVTVVKNTKVAIENRFKIVDRIAHLPLKNQCLSYLALDTTVSQSNRRKAAQAIQDEALQKRILSTLEEMAEAHTPNAADRIEALMAIQDVAQREEQLFSIVLDVDSLITIREEALRKIQTKALMERGFSIMAQNKALEASRRMFYVNQMSTIELKNKTLCAMALDKHLAVFERLAAANKINDEGLKDEALGGIIQDKDLSLDTRLSRFELIKNPTVVSGLLEVLAQDDTISHREELYEMCIQYNRVDLTQQAMQTSVDGLDAVAKASVCKKKIAAAQALRTQDLEAEAIDEVLSELAQDPSLDLKDRFDALRIISRTRSSFKDNIYTAIALDDTITDEYLARWRLEAAARMRDLIKKQEAYVFIAKDPGLSEEIRLKAAQRIKDSAAQQAVYLYLAKDVKIAADQRLRLADAIHDSALQEDVYCELVKESGLSKFSRLQILENIENTDKKDQACLAMAQDPSMEEGELNALLRMTSSENILIKDSIYAILVRNKKIPIAKRLDGVDKITDQALLEDLLQDLMKDSSVNIHQRLYAMLIQNNHLDWVIEALHLPLEGLDAPEKAILIRKKIAAAEALQVEDIEMEAVERVMAIIVRDEGIDINDRLYILDRLTFRPDAVGEIVNFLLNDPVLDRLSHLYRYFYNILIKHNQVDCVQTIMNTSLEGLEGDAMEAVRKKKIAAAEAVIEIDAEHVDAIYILMTMRNPDENSPYRLYQVVLEKSKEEVSLGDVLESKKRVLASELKDCTMYLNGEAFMLPKVMDAKWKEGFENINFNSFYQQIKRVFEGYRDALESRIEKLEAIDAIKATKKGIKDSVDLQGDYLKYFSGEDRSTLQEALKTRNRKSVHGNKMKAIAEELQTCIDKELYSEGLGILSDLKVNMETCKGGDQQAIEMCYMNRMLSKDIEAKEEKSLDQVAASLRIEKEKVWNVCYKIRSNWILENHNVVRNGKSCVAYSPQKAGESFVETLKKLYPSLENCLSGSSFDNTHYGLAIMGIIGKVIGLRGKDSHPAFDPNCEAAKSFIMSPFITKANLLEAFTRAFTFENTWESIAKELFESLALESKLEGYAFFADEACTKKLDLSLYQDPLCKGAEAFLKNIGFESDAINSVFRTQKCYYKDPTFGDTVDYIQMNIGFSKEGLAKILQKIGLLSVV